MGNDSLLSRWQAVARLPGELVRISRKEDRLPFLYDELKSLLGMSRVRLFPIGKPMAELTAPGRDRVEFFEYIALQRQPVLISNVADEHLDLPDEIAEWKFPTLLFMPLISNHTALGALVLASESQRDLTGDDGELIDVLLPIIAHTVELDTLSQEIELQVQYNRLLEEVDALMMGKSIAEILASVVVEIHRALKVERTLIFAKRGHEELDIATAIGCPYASEGRLRNDACGVLARRVFMYNRSEVLNATNFREIGLKRPVCVSERQVAAVPIATADQAYGVIECFNRIDGKDFEGHQVVLLERVAGRMALAIANSELVGRIREAGLNAVIGLATALDAKDNYTAMHSHNVGEYSYRIGVSMGLPPDECERIKLAGILHDLGKIGIPDEVLNKPGKLTDAEFTLIKSHPVMTAKILAHFHDLADVRRSAATHHERWDGLGYPDRLKAEKIPIGGRIICLADAFDTLTSDRKYRPRMSLEFSLQEMRRNAGRQFDAECVEALFSALMQLGSVDLNGNDLPSREELERMRTEPLPPLKPSGRPKPIAEKEEADTKAG